MDFDIHRNYFEYFYFVLNFILNEFRNIWINGCQRLLVTMYYIMIILDKL